MSATPSTITGTLDVLRQPVTIAAPDTTASDIFGILRGGAALASEVMDTNRRFDREVQQMEREAADQARRMAQEAIDEDNRDRAIAREGEIEREKLERERVAIQNGQFLEASSLTVQEIREQIERNAPSVVEVAWDDPEKQWAWSQDVVRGVAQSQNIAIEDVERNASVVALQIREMIGQKGTAVRREAEQDRHSRATLALQLADPLDFRVTVDALEANSTPEKVFSDVVAPALSEVAKSGNVDRVKSIIAALGYDKDENRIAFANDVVQSATVAQTRLRNQQQNQARAQVVNDMFFATDAEGNPDVGKLVAINDRISAALRNNEIDPDFALEAQDRIRRDISRIGTERARAAESESRQLAINNAVLQMVPQALGDGMVVGEDVTVTYQGFDQSGQPTNKTVTINRNDFREQVMQSVMSNVTQQVQGLPPQQAFTRIFAVAARNNYVPPAVKEEMPGLRNRVSQSIASGNFVVPANAERLLTQYRAMSPVYRESVLSVNDRAFYERVEDLMQLPGATLAESLRVAGRAENQPFPINREAISASVRTSINTIASENTRSVYASWIERRAGAYALYGHDADKAAAKAMKDFEALSGEINGHKVLYAGQYAPVNGRPFAEVVDDFVQEVMIPRIMQENPTVLADPTDPNDRDALDPDALVPMIDPQSGTLRLYEQNSMTPFFSDSRDTVSIEDIYRHAKNANKANESMMRQSAIQSQSANVESYVSNLRERELQMQERSLPFRERRDRRLARRNARENP